MSTMPEPQATGPIRLTVASAGLPWINANNRLHFMARSALTRNWRVKAAVEAINAGVPRLEKARIECELLFSDSRRRDPGNWAPTAKAAIDGLVDAGVFVDDSYEYVIGPDMRIGEKVIGANVGIRLVLYPMRSDA